MKPKKHDTNLANLLLEYNGKLVGVAGSPYPENNNGYGLQTLIITYQNERQRQIVVGVTLVSKEVIYKKDNPTRYTNLSVVDLSRVKNREDLIYRLLRSNIIQGIADLSTVKYTISEGIPAIDAYNQLNAAPPENTKDLAEVLRNSWVHNSHGTHSYRTHQEIASIIPNPQLRLNLGRF